MSDRYRDRWRQTEREAENQRAKRKDSERIRNRDKDGVREIESDTEKQRDAKRVSRESEMRVPKKTGRNRDRVQGRAIRKQEKRRSDSEPTWRDKQTLRQRLPESQNMRRAEKGKQQRKPAGACITLPVSCAVATPCVAVHVCVGTLLCIH